jgi:hypothetical protein
MRFQMRMTDGNLGGDGKKSTDGNFASSGWVTFKTSRPPLFRKRKITAGDPGNCFEA